MKWILITLVLMALLMPFAQAYEKWEAVCIGNVLVQNSTLKVGDDPIDLIEKNVTCPYGCDSGRRICNDYSGEPGTAIPLVMFILFLLIGWGLLAWSFLSTDTLNKLISGLFSAILLFVLGLLSLNVMVESVAMQFTWLAWLNWALGFIGVAMVIYSMLMLFKDINKME